MLDVVAATAIAVTGDAGSLVGRPYPLGHFYQIGLFLIQLGIAGVAKGHAGGGRRFFVSAGGVVTDQAINPALVTEVERGVLPAVADMATGAARLVAVNGDAEVVDDVLFAPVDGPLPFYLLGEGPGPVTGFHHRDRRIFVAFQAFFGDIHGGGKGTADSLMRLVGTGRSSAGHHQGRGSQDGLKFCFPAHDSSLRAWFNCSVDPYRANRFPAAC